MHIALLSGPSTTTYVFAYTPEFATQGIEPAPLHMPVVVDEPFLFTDLPEATYKRLPAMLNDALPGKFGNAHQSLYGGSGIAAGHLP